MLVTHLLSSHHACALPASSAIKTWAQLSPPGVGDRPKDLPGEEETLTVTALRLCLTRTDLSHHYNKKKPDFKNGMIVPFCFLHCFGQNKAPNWWLAGLKWQVCNLTQSSNTSGAQLWQANVLQGHGNGNTPVHGLHWIFQLKKENVAPSNNRIRINNKRKPTQEDRGSYTLEMPFDVNVMSLSIICFIKNWK